MKTLDELLTLLSAKLPEDADAAETLGPAMRDRRLARAEDLLAIPAPAEFIRQAFRFVLKREPEDDALRHYGGLLESGQRDRRSILQDLLNSEEGKANGGAVIGVSSDAAVSAEIAREQRRLSATMARLETEVAAISAQLHRIPCAQRALLEAVAELLEHRAQDTAAG
jgi:hypothetical protein